MAIFLDAQDAYRLMQRELPEGVYADGSPSAHYTTASVYAKAKTIETAYNNMNRIYQNMFPQSADEKIFDWEVKVFGKVQDSTLSLAERQNNLVLKLRSRPGINRAAIADIVVSVVGPDILFSIIDWNCGGAPGQGGEGAWLLGESQLGINTYINGARMSDVTPFLFPDGDFCSTDHAPFGKTDQEWALMQEQAFTYEVIFYGYTLTADQRSKLDELLQIGEPARSQHYITDNADINDLPGGSN